MDWTADRSLAFFVKLPTVGIAINMRIAMMAMTMSNSISVKPLGSVVRRLFASTLFKESRNAPRQNEKFNFIGFQCLAE